MKQISLWQSRFNRASKTELALSKRISRVLHARRINADLLYRLLGEQIAAIRTMSKAQDRIRQYRLSEIIRSIFQRSPVSKTKT